MIRANSTFKESVGGKKYLNFTCVCVHTYKQPLHSLEAGKWKWRECKQPHYLCLCLCPLNPTLPDQILLRYLHGNWLDLL